MNDPTRRAVLFGLVSVSLTALAGCSGGETVVGPGAGGMKRTLKGREEAEIEERNARSRRGRPSTSNGTQNHR